MCGKQLANFNEWQKTTLPTWMGRSSSVPHEQYLSRGVSMASSDAGERVCVETAGGRRDDACESSSWRTMLDFCV